MGGSGLSPEVTQTMNRIIIGAGIAVILIDLGLLIVWLIRQPAVRAGKAPPFFAPRWSLLDAWLAGQVVTILTLVSAVVAIGIVTVFFAMVQGPSALRADALMSGKSPLMLISLLIILVAQNAFLIGVPLGLIRFRYQESFRNLGIMWLPGAEDIVLGLSLGLVMFVIGVVLEIVLALVLSVTLGPQKYKELTQVNESLTVNGMMKGGMSPGLFVTLFLGGAVAAPIGEEIFFRGFLYNAAKRRFGIAGGVAISAAVFALVHLGPLAVVGIIALGVMLALAYEFSGSLWVPILMHMTNNGIAIILSAFHIGT